MNRKELFSVTSGLCRGCPKCNGFACRGEVPGMGGKGEGLTFINNYKSWESIDVEEGDMPLLGVAPMTGVDQNMGNPFSEAQFHNYIVKGAKDAGILSCIGDGTPDHKLLDGIAALKNNSVTGTVFIKPYPNNIVKERFELASEVCDIIGIDIDSYRIPTMDGLVQLEKKTSSQLIDLKNSTNKKFVIKGVESLEDVETVKSVKPDIVVVSNHGGRVFDNGEGIAYRLQKIISLIKGFTGEVWVDGGLRSVSHLKKASALGAKRVLIGRPFIQATALLKDKGIPSWLKNLK